jgi:hypothetical protein
MRINKATYAMAAQTYGANDAIKVTVEPKTIDRFRRRVKVASLGV